MKRDTEEEDNKKISNKETIIKKLEIAQKKLNEVEVSSFDPTL